MAEGPSAPSPAPKLLFVGGDLMAAARVESAARAAGTQVARGRPGRLPDDLRAGGYDIVVLDLDAGGLALLAQLEAARAEGLVTGRVVGYYSHVDEALGRAARAAGCDAVPRGRFWRTLPELVGGGPAP